MKKLLKIFLYIVIVLIVLFLIPYVLTMGDYKVPATVEHDPSLPHIELNGYTFHAETFGDPSNPLIIVLHGGPGGDYRYLYPLKGLADDYFLVFYDQRGAGLSPRVPPQDISIDGYLQDVDAFVEHFGRGKKVNLIGHSWGGMLASAYIGKYPHKVNKAVLAEPGFLNLEMADKLMKQLRKIDAATFYYMAKCWFQSLHVSRTDEHARSDFFVMELSKRSTPEYYCEGKMPEGVEFWRMGASCMNRFMSMLQDPVERKKADFTVGVENFHNKVLFIASECNKLIGEEHQREQMKYFPNAELLVIQDAGHLMFNEKTEECLQIIRSYFTEQNIEEIGPAEE
jgi:proline iminopeptidase